MITCYYCSKIRDYVHKDRPLEVAQENPDLTYKFIKGILTARQEARAKKLQSYVFDKQ